MYAVMRSYSGKNANKLFDVIEKNRAEVEKLVRPIKGFIGYTLVRTDGGGFSVTVCWDKAGTDESVRMARNWIDKNARDIRAAAPIVLEGPVILHLG